MTDSLNTVSGTAICGGTDYILNLDVSNLNNGSIDVVSNIFDSVNNFATYSDSTVKDDALSLS